MADLVHIAEEGRRALHGNDSNLLKVLLSSRGHVLFGGEMILVDVVTEQGKHGDHEGTLHRNPVDDLPSRFEDTLDL